MILVTGLLHSIANLAAWQAGGVAVLVAARCLLYCTLLYYTVLYCALLYCTVQVPTGGLRAHAVGGGLHPDPGDHAAQPPHRHQRRHQHQ